MCLEREQNTIPIIPAVGTLWSRLTHALSRLLPTIAALGDRCCLRLTYAVITLCLRHPPTKAGLIYAVLPLSPTHIRPGSDGSRSVWSVLLTTLHRPTAKWGHVPEGRVRHTKLLSNLLSLEMCHLHLAWHQTPMRLKARFSTGNRACLEREQNTIPIIPAVGTLWSRLTHALSRLLPTIAALGDRCCLRLTYAVITLCLRHPPTKAGLIYAVLPLSPTHIRPGSDGSRSVWSVLLTTLHRPTAKWGHVPEGRVRHTKLLSNLLSLEMCHLHLAWHQTPMRLKARFSTRFNP